MRSYAKFWMRSWALPTPREVLNAKFCPSHTGMRCQYEVCFFVCWVIDETKLRIFLTWSMYEVYTKLRCEDIMRNLYFNMRSLKRSMMRSWCDICSAVPAFLFSRDSHPNMRSLCNFAYVWYEVYDFVRSLCEVQCEVNAKILHLHDMKSWCEINMRR